MRRTLYSALTDEFTDTSLELGYDLMQSFSSLGQSLPVVVGPILASPMGNRKMQMCSEFIFNWYSIVIVAR